jgi:cyclic nucleotide gated channel alpha 1
MKFSYIVYRIVRLVLMLLLLVLWLGSIFFAIDYYFYKRKGEYYPVHLWLTNTKASQYLDGTFIDLYTTYEWYVWLVYAVYWTLQSVSLLGYGDITPRNPYEVAFCDVALVIITLIYALFISAVWKILEEVTQSETKSDKILKQYLKNYGIGGDTVAKLSGYAAEAI